MIHVIAFSSPCALPYPKVVHLGSVPVAPLTSSNLLQSLPEPAHCSRGSSNHLEEAKDDKSGADVTIVVCFDLAPIKLNVFHTAYTEKR